MKELKHCFQKIAQVVMLLLLFMECYGQTSDSINLKEVTVTAKNIITTPDKTIIIPTAQVKKHSFDGYTMLSLLHIPDLKVNIFDNMVSANGGEAIMVCINGVMATTEEVLALNPKYVKKIDYYSNFDPRHPEADRVIDFIVQIRETGGELMIKADQRLNILQGDDMAYWKIFSGNTEIALSAKDNYRNYTNDIGSVMRTVMKFPDMEIIKDKLPLPSRERKNEVGGGATVLHRSDNALFKAGVNINTGHDVDDSGECLSYEGIDIMDTESHTHKHSDNTNSNFKLQYDKGFKNQSILSFSVSGGYSYTDLSRAYTSIDYLESCTGEKYYKLSPGISYTMRFMDKKLSVFAKINHYYDRSEQEYTENSIKADQTLTFNQTLLQLGANIKFIKDLSATVRLQDRILYKTSTSVNEKSDKHTFTPSLILSYRLGNGDRMSTFWTSGLFSPDLSYFSTTEKRINEFKAIVGNPHLKLEGILQGGIRYSHYFPWGSISPELALKRMFHPVYSTEISDADRKLYITTYRNGGNSTTFNPNINAYVTLIRDKLSMWLNVEYRYRQIHTYTEITKNCVIGSGGLTYMNNGLSGEISCMLPWKDLLDNGLYVSRPIDLRVSLSYIYKNLSLALMAKNPLYKVRHSYDYSLPNGYQEQDRSWMPRENYNYFEARVGFRLSYGRQHKFQDVDVDSNGGSAILGF